MVNKTTVFAVIAIALCVSGCASKAIIPLDTSKTTVVLLPDEDGHVGAVSVSTPDGSQTVDEAYSSSIADSTRSGPSESQSLGEAQVSAAYKDVLNAQPSKPESFILYFVLGSTVLTAQSKAMLPAVFEAVRARKPTEISIFGHTDAIGSDEWNFKLSAGRAKAVEKALRKRDPSLGDIEIQFFGDKEPLVPTPPDVPEPRNRRAEILIL